MDIPLSRRRALGAGLLLGAWSLVGAARALESTENADSGRRMTRIPLSLAIGEVYVSLADRRLYHVRARGRAVSYPIATPRDRDLWEGTQIVTAKRVNPSWVPTPNMLRENPRLPKYVPGGHRFNPMGARALHLGHTYYRIHGTDAPWLIGQNVSKGCIRMLNPHVIELFDAVPVGAKVTVTRTSLVASTEHRVPDQVMG